MPLKELTNAVNGICTEMDLLLNQMIISVDLAQEIFQHLIKKYSKNIGKADPDHIADIFVSRMQQQVE